MKQHDDEYIYSSFTSDIHGNLYKLYMVKGIKYNIKITKDIATKTFTVQCVELPAAIEQGDTLHETIERGKQAILSVLEYDKASKEQDGPIP